MIARDLYFNNKEVADIGAVEEDEIDISEDARNFQTIDNIDQFIAAANDYAENGEMGEAAEVCNKWVMSV